MHQVEFHKRAIKALRRIPDDRADQILNQLDALAELPDPTTHPDVKMMKGDREGSWRLRVGTYRVVFRLMVLAERRKSRGLVTDRICLFKGFLLARRTGRE